jgi:hypothetical protein
MDRPSLPGAVTSKLGSNEHLRLDQCPVNRKCAGAGFKTIVGAVAGGMQVQRSADVDKLPGRGGKCCFGRRSGANQIHETGRRPV